MTRPGPAVRAGKPQISVDRLVSVAGGHPAFVNDQLRRWWSRVRLDCDQNPTVEWFMTPKDLEAREAAAQ